MSERPSLIVTPDPQPTRMVEFGLPLAPGRSAVVALPSDASDSEMLLIIAGVLDACAQVKVQRPKPGPNLTIARVLPT